MAQSKMIAKFHHLEQINSLLLYDLIFTMTMTANETIENQQLISDEEKFGLEIFKDIFSNK